MSEEVTLYKVLVNGESCHGGSLRWSLPNGVPGEWHEVTGSLILCHRGIHLTRKPQNWAKHNARVYEAEYEGECVDDGVGDKLCVRRARLLREVEWSRFGVHVFTDGEHGVDAGVCFAFDSASVKAFGSASVKAFGSASVKAFDSASVEAFDSASVKAFGSASVEAFDSASVEAFDSASVKAFGSASVEAFDSASVKASGSASVKAFGSASVKAFGSASVEAFGSASVIRTPWHALGKVTLEGDAACIDRTAGPVRCYTARDLAEAKQPAMEDVR